MTDADHFARFSRTDALRANLKRKSIRSAIFMASGNGSEILIRFGAIAILARLLSPEDFGLVAIVTALTGVLDGFKDLGLSTATVQRSEITHRQITNLFWVNVSVGCLLGLALCGAAPLIATFFEDERLVSISLALSLVFVWNGLTIQHEALMTRQMRQGELAAIRLLASLTSVAVAIWLAIHGWGYWALVWREIARSAIISIGVWVGCRWLPGLPTRHAGTRSLIRFGGEVSVTYLLVNLTSHIDRLLIGRFFGATPVGMYRQAQQLVLAPIEQLNVPIIGVAQPALSALQHDAPRYRRFYEKIVFLVTLGTLPLGLFVAVYAEDITLLALGRNWIDAAVFVRIFGIAAAIRPAIGTSAIVLLTCGYSTRFMALTVAHSVLLTALLFAGVKWGATGVALASLATTLALAYPKLYYSFAKTPASIGGFFAALRVPLVSGLVMAGCLTALRYNTPAVGVMGSLFLGVLVGGTIYFGTVWAQSKGRTELRTLLVDMRAALNRRRTPAVDAS